MKPPKECMCEESTFKDGVCEKCGKDCWHWERDDNNCCLYCGSVAEPDWPEPEREYEEEANGH